MAYRFFTAADARTRPIIPIETAVFSAWLEKQPAEMRKWVDSAGFLAKPGSISLVAGKDGALSTVLLGVDDHQGLSLMARFSSRGSPRSGSEQTSGSLPDGLTNSSAPMQPPPLPAPHVDRD